MSELKGHCEHGEFDLLEGCPQCIAEKKAAENSTGDVAISLSTTAVPMPEVEGVDVKYGGEWHPIPEDEKVDGLTEEEQNYEAAKADQPGPDIPEYEKLWSIAPNVDAETLGYYNEALKLQKYAESRVIDSAEDIHVATDDLSVISRLKKAMEEKRKEYLSPLQEQVKQINETYKTMMAPIEIADKVTRDKMLVYHQEQKRIREEQERINQLRIEAAEKEAALSGTGEITESVDLIDVKPVLPTTTRTESGTAGQRDNWRYEVTDFALLPDAYKIADGAQLNAIAKSHHDRKQIPGVRFYNEPTIIVRPR